MRFEGTGYGKLRDMSPSALPCVTVEDGVASAMSFQRQSRDDSDESSWTLIGAITTFERTNLGHAEFRRHCPYRVNLDAAEKWPYQALTIQRVRKRSHLEAVVMPPPDYQAAYEADHVLIANLSRSMDTAASEMLPTKKVSEATSPVLEMWPAHATPASLVRVKSSGMLTHRSRVDSPGVPTLKQSLHDKHMPLFQQGCKLRQPRGG